MRDFLPADIRKRNYVIGIIKEVYESYGFEPLETPAVENLETLMGKYGDEGNQLVFKILKRGEKLDFENAKSESDLSDLALRYDLTVPLARVVANNKNELPKFFKRYQIQPVWRADRPAKGRFREFYQCDVDIIGSESMVVEAELCSAFAEVLKRLGFNRFSILLNHRELLFGALEVCGIPSDLHTTVLVSIDKQDKIGRNGVLDELREKGNISDESIQKVGTFLDAMYPISDVYSGSVDAAENEFNRRSSMNQALLSSLRTFLGDNPSGTIGLDALETILRLTENTPAREKMTVFPNLARGLSYYTGAILEIGLDAEDFTLSLGGGGRYDGLIGMFGKEQIPACGFSFGLERILVVMDERGMFPPEIAESVPADVMVTIWSEETVGESLKLAADLRKGGLRVTVYPEADKLGKQIKYADSIGVPFVCIIGPEEAKSGLTKLKNMKTREESPVDLAAIVEKVKGREPKATE